MSKEYLSPILMQDMSRYGEGAVLGGPIYEDVIEKSREQVDSIKSSEQQESKRRKILNILAKRAPLLAVSLSVVACGGESRQISPVSSEDYQPKIIASDNGELREFNATIESINQEPSSQLEVCPDIPPGGEIREESGFMPRAGNPDNQIFKTGERICYAGPNRENPNEFIVDLWTVGEKDNDNQEIANCLLIYSNPLPVDEIDKICDELHLFPQTLQQEEPQLTTLAHQPDQENKCEVTRVPFGTTIWGICEERVPENVSSCVRWTLDQNMLNSGEDLRTGQYLIVPVKGEGLPGSNECQLGVGGSLPEVEIVSPLKSEIIDVPYSSVCSIQLIPEVYNAGFVIGTEFQEAYERLEDFLGPPINDQIGEIGRFSMARQYFTNGVLSSMMSDYYPGMELTTEEGSIKREPIGWYSLNWRLQRIRPSINDSEWVNLGDYQIDPRLETFYKEKGGEAVLGIPISPLTQLGDEEFVQWTTFSRLHFRNGEVSLDPLGEEAFYYRVINIPGRQEPHHPFRFKYHPEIIVRMDPILDLELKVRTESLLAIVSQGTGEDCFLDSRSDSYRDFMIYAYHNGKIGEHGEVKSAPVPSFERVYSTLAAHELEYVRNPVIQQAAQEMEASGAMRALNKMLRDNVSPDLFKESEIPSLPETKDEILDAIIFAGGLEALGGGLAYDFHPLLWGRYDRRELSYEEAGRIFANQYTHEAVHSLLQYWRSERLEGVDWWTPSPEARLVHGLHFIAEDMVERITGLGGSEPPPLLVFVYGVLEEGEIDNPFGELLSSMATGSYLASYDEVRGDNSSLAEIFAYDDWHQLSPEIQSDVEEMYRMYKDKFVDFYMRYAEQY